MLTSYYIKIKLQSILPKNVYRIIKKIQRWFIFQKNYGFSEEEKMIAEYLDKISIQNDNKFCVDIACQDGVQGSQTLALFKKGWKGIAVELDEHYFKIVSSYYRIFNNVSLIRSKITPNNVVHILKGLNCPINFGFLSLDIDSYDYYILNNILSEFRPSLICLEINEVVPPPIKFTVSYSEDFHWGGVESHFQGQSISMAYELCLKYNYVIIQLYYNNLFIVPKEINIFEELTPAKAYQVGYKLKEDRHIKFPWNKDMENIFQMNENDAVNFLKEKFKNNNGKYTIEI